MARGCRSHSARSDAAPSPTVTYFRLRKRIILMARRDSRSTSPRNDDGRPHLPPIDAILGCKYNVYLSLVILLSFLIMISFTWCLTYYFVILISVDLLLTCLFVYY